MNETEWMEKIQHYKLNESDLSRDADLSVGVMNVISAEEHLEFSFAKTQDPKYLSMLSSVRVVRKELLQKLIGFPPAEEWCLSKHLLSASMRLFEVGTKELDAGNTTSAAAFFNSGYELYSLFFGLKLGVVAPAQISAAAKTVIEKNTQTAPDIEPDAAQTTESVNASPAWRSGLQSVIQKIVNCCKE